jgi:hypothetical protein
LRKYPTLKKLWTLWQGLGFIKLTHIILSTLASLSVIVLMLTSYVAFWSEVEACKNVSRSDFVLKTVFWIVWIGGVGAIVLIWTR